MDRNKVEQEVFDFLVGHHLAMDLPNYSNARSTIFMFHLESLKKKKLKKPKIRNQIKTIDEYCSLSKLLQREESYFSDEFPDFVYPNPEYKALCRQIKESLTRIVIDEKTDVQDHDKMVSAWERAVSFAIGQKGAYNNLYGLNKLEQMYKTRLALTFSPEKPLVNDFVRCVVQEEQSYYTGLFMHIMSRVATQNAIDQGVIPDSEDSYAFIGYVVNQEEPLGVQIIARGTHKMEIINYAAARSLDVEKIEMAVIGNDPFKGLGSMRGILERHL